jgi:putative oxidoreductase
MKALINLAQLNFLPRSTDLGLLVLRLWLGLSLAVLHGWAKLMGFAAMAEKFADPIGVGPQAALAMTIFAEVVCAVLLAMGLFTRFAAAVLTILMAVAFFVVHSSALSGPASGEMAFIYLGGFVTLLLTGAGRFSLDAKLSPPSVRGS